MLKRLSSGLSILILMIVFAAVAGSAHAQVTDCTGNLAPGNYVAVNVPAGATCTINTIQYGANIYKIAHDAYGANTDLGMDLT